jgi:hypothetical protein
VCGPRSAPPFTKTTCLEGLPADLLGEARGEEQRHAPRHARYPPLEGPVAALDAPRPVVVPNTRTRRTMHNLRTRNQGRPPPPLRIKKRAPTATSPTEGSPPNGSMPVNVRARVLRVCALCLSTYGALRALAR